MGTIAAATLNSRLGFSEKNFFKYGNERRFKPFTSGPVIVQKTRTCPQPSVIICNSLSFMPKFKELLSGVQKEQRLALLGGMERSIASTVEALRATPCLAIDFQVMLSLPAKTMYQFDLDRCATKAHRSRRDPELVDHCIDILRQVNVTARKI